MAAHIEEPRAVNLEAGTSNAEMLQRPLCASPWRLLAASLVGFVMLAAATTRANGVSSLLHSPSDAALPLERRLQRDHRVRDWPSTKFYTWEAYGPQRAYVSTSPACCGWKDQGTFYAFRSYHPGLTKYYVWTAHGPQRTLIQKSRHCCGWKHLLSFYAFDSKQKDTKKYYVWSTTLEGVQRGMIRDEPACCGWKNEFAFWAYASPPGHVVFCSDISKVTGRWANLGAVVGKQTRIMETGTQRTDTTSSAAEFASSVALGLEIGAEMNYGVKKGTVKVRAEYSTSWATSYSKELSQQLTSRSTFKIEVGTEYAGKQLWQFQFDTMDECRSGSTTWTHSYALTESAASYPCCYPGHCRDAALSSCNWCTKGYTIAPGKDFPQCKEGDPPCEPDTAVQLLHELPGFVRLPEQLPHDEHLTVSCPDGFTGEVELQCELGSLSVRAQSCQQN